MKYLCEGCERLVAPAGFRLEPGTAALLLTCERCGADTRAEAPVRQSAAPPPAADSRETRDAATADAAARSDAARDDWTRNDLARSDAARSAATRAEATRADAARVDAARADAARANTAWAEADAPRDEAAAADPRAEPAPAEHRAPPALRVVSLRPSGETVRQAAALARSEDPFAPPPGHCPKCLARRREGSEVCAACGLAYANFRPEEHRPSGPLGEAWVELLAHWDEEARHERFVQLALARGELAGAGKLYRLRLVQAPQDLFAQRGRDEVLRLASISSGPAQLAREEGAAEGRSRSRLVVQVLIMLVLLVLAVMFVGQLKDLLSGPSH
ncbi:hypothetical protein FGE12_05010 [Aggregicoccus sp. 17bor-14]|uniref:hypothetical protein n=1 Tax=Myxococcaceae TaxID=31 RepID=UPI00129C934B|nr:MULTISPECIES: hypothetical protein [Myxococcaceae]MBF5041740.1 hypothetical protein [Simulacricoccus sp. 17bor-14]MRI87521.1 hypothetical protein [Aggregicoccus sp. 17bor-14]